MSKVIPWSLQLERAEKRVRREILWFAKYQSIRWTQAHYEHIVRMNVAMRERNRLRSIIRLNNQLKEKDTMKQCGTCSSLENTLASRREALDAFQKDVAGKYPTMNYRQAHESVQKGRELTKAFQSAERALKRHEETRHVGAE